MAEEIKIYRNESSSKNFSNLFRKFSITNWLIIVNIVIFIISYLLINNLGEEKVFKLFALQANSFFSGNYWTLLTSMFMHGGLAHLLFNMISLFFIGNFIEKIIGRRRFFWFYLISGILAGLFYVTLSYFFGVGYLGEKLFVNPNIFAVGASGAIFALLGLLALLTPFNRVYLIAGPLIAIIVQAILAQFLPESLISGFDIFITIYFFIAVFSMFSFNSKLRKIAIPLEMPFWLLPIIAIVPLVIIGLFIDLPIGNTAHLGGLLIGLLYAYYLKKKYKKKTELIKRYFSR
ncbi:MAG: rhomboid family intramembrane serine protease [Candidatus Nanoarchaeia archaeon]|nr:rhomboid family intramembrane serine protease [Candidatus Nanoarchaeia archaeon]